MSFASPLLLLCLLAVPAILVWYVERQHVRARAVAAFAAPRMTLSVMPQPPGWRRHAPMAVFLLAIVALAIAAARPRVTVTVAVQRLQTMLALDMSGSMQATDVSPSRATAAQRAADVFVTGSPSAVRVGVMQFNHAPLVLALPTRYHQAALNALGHLRIGGGTAVGNAIEASLGILEPVRNATGQTAAGSGVGSANGLGAGSGPGTGSGLGAGNNPGAGGGASPNPKNPAAAVVLLSDGKSTSGPDPLAAARRARALHIPIFTVSLGTPDGTIPIPRKDGTGTATVPVPPEPRALAQIAQISGGHAYTAADAGHLSAIYRQLSAQLAHHRERHEITDYMVGAGLGLLLLGGGLSLGWFGRLM